MKQNVQLTLISCLAFAGCTSSGPTAEGPSAEGPASKTFEPVDRSDHLAPARIVVEPDYEFANNKLILEVNDEGRLILSAVQSRVDYKEIFTHQLPTYASLQGVDFVLDAEFFNEHFPPVLAIDDAVVVRFEPLTRAQYSLLPSGENLVSLAESSTATLDYATSLQGKGQRVEFQIGALEYAKESLAARIDNKVTTPEHAKELVASAFDHENPWRVSASRLRAVPNGKGDGAFVHIPTFTVAGYERHPVWFVVEESVLALNSPSKTLTPEAPWTRDRPDINWTATGFQGGRVSASDLPGSQ